MTATAMSSPPSASPVRRQSCQVGAGGHCGLLPVPLHWSYRVQCQGSKRELNFCPPAAPSLHGVGWAQSGETTGCDEHSPDCVCFPFLWGSELRRRKQRVSWAFSGMC